MKVEMILNLFRYFLYIFLIIGTWQQQPVANNICLVIGKKNSLRSQNESLKTFFDEISGFDL